MSSLHVYSRGKHVATINAQSPAADTYRREEPWLLLHNTGRVDRFASQREARQEATKSWPAICFSRT